MSTVLYLHGFLSSPQSHKCQITKAWLAAHYCEVDFIAPTLSSYPQYAQQTLIKVLDSLAGKDVFAIGSSLGGFWATYLVETQRIKKAVLINPGVMPQNRFHEFIGQKLKSYYGDEEYCLSEKDLQDLSACDIKKIRQYEKLWLMVQKGDETLDYRLAVEKYHGCRQLIEDGGSHAFDGYEHRLQDIMDFFECASC